MSPPFGVCDPNLCVAQLDQATSQIVRCCPKLPIATRRNSAIPEVVALYKLDVIQWGLGAPAAVADAQFRER